MADHFPGVCLYYLKNKCTRENCERLHPPNVVLPVEGFICKHFLQGTCIYDPCWKIHPVIEGVLQPVEAPPPPRDVIADGPTWVFPMKTAPGTAADISNSRDLWADAHAEEDEKEAPTVPAKICKHFKFGKCRYGSDCKFTHPAAPLGNDRILSGDEWRAQHRRTVRP